MRGVSGRVGCDADYLPLVLAFRGERDLAADEREQRVVLAHPDVDARMDLRPALANDDATRVDEFAALTPRRFDSESRPVLELPPAFLCAMVNALRQPTMLSILSSV